MATNVQIVLEKISKKESMSNIKETKGDDAEYTEQALKRMIQMDIA
jgi:hypothetical protein